MQIRQLSSAAESSTRTAHSPGRPFPKGTSGNPGGRPKGLVAAIRAKTNDGAQLVEFMLRVFRGEEPGTKLAHRIEAATWLADRGFGKPIQAMAHAATDGERLIPLDVLRAVVADADASGAA